MKFEVPKEEICHVTFSLSTQTQTLSSTKAKVHFPVLCRKCTYNLLQIEYETLAKTDENNDVIGFVFRGHCPNCEARVEVNPDWFISKTIYPKRSFLRKVQKFFGW